MRETIHKALQRTPQGICLKEICFQAVRKHFSALGIKSILELPARILKDLLPHLTVCQLDELQPELNHRGISTQPVWLSILHDMRGPSPACYTEEEAKHEVMRMLFKFVFYGFITRFVKRNFTNLNTPSFLWAAAKCIRYFEVNTSLHEPLQSLTADQRPLLSLLEKRITSVGIMQSVDISVRKIQTALYVLHRLLDHGVAKEVVVNVQCPIVLAWLLHGRGSQYVCPELKKLMHRKTPNCISQTTSASANSASCNPGPETKDSDDQEDQVAPCKRSKLDYVGEKSGEEDFTVDPQVLCQTFAVCDGPSAGVCRWGQIECLEIRNCGSNSLRVLNAALPTFFCLRSLTLHRNSTFMDSEVCYLARALTLLSKSSHSSLTDLNISILPNTKLMEQLLDATPKVTSLHVESQTLMWRANLPLHCTRTSESDMSELLLEKLTIKVTEVQTDLNFLTSVLRRSPHLTSVHMAGMRPPTGSSQSQLLSTLSEANHCLRSLILEDINLSACLPEILHLLSSCKLEELQLNDCRLLEKWSDKEEGLKQLVAALKTVPSLHMLSLAQNRLAKNVFVLAELFSGPSPSLVKRLDISSNFIQPAELLEFAKRLRNHRPPHRLTFDLRKNPGDRDPDTWTTALETLCPFGDVLLERWNSTNTMVDHVSNM